MNQQQNHITLIYLLMNDDEGYLYPN